MAEKDILSQEEIDALLHSVEPGEEAVSEGEGATQEANEVNHEVQNVPEDSAFKTTVRQNSDSPPEDEIKTVNFISQERIVRGQLPVLDKINDRVIRMFSGDIYQLAARDFEIKQEPLAIIKHHEFMSSLSNPMMMSTYRLRPLRGKALIAFDSTFVFDLVDFYFGGNSQFTSQKERTDFTATENRVMENVTKKLVENIVKAWESIIELSPMKMNEETNPQLIHISEPNEMLLVTKFNINFGQEQGMFLFALPYFMIEPIKQQLDLGATRPDDEIDPNWINSLKDELMDVELVVSATMAECQSSLGTVLAWQVGDFIPVELKDEVNMDIEGTPSFIATQGSAGDKRALKIIHKIDY